MPSYPIDIVVPWVDGGDSQWIAERNKFRPKKSTDNNEARYRDWGLFEYWFRSIELYAPWVRTVHLITWGHLPKWLETNHPKLHIVNHKDYIPEKYLPVFSSHPIENYIHKISDLAEHFILFNDDLYLTRPTKPEDFFVNGLPVDTASLGFMNISDSVSFMPYIALNCLGIINENFSKKKILRRDCKKWFNLKYGKTLLHNVYFSLGKNFNGFRSFHNAMPYLKSSFEEVWDKFPEVLDETCSHRFRSREDVNHYLIRYWRLCKGDFVPAKPKCAYFTIGVHGVSAIKSAMNNKKYIMVCVNDDPTGLDFEKAQKEFKAVFEELYPNKCSFEKN